MLFQVGRRGYLAVALINVVTNPLMNLIVYVLIAYPPRPLALSGLPDLAIVALAEAAVVLVEWRLLVWALPDSAGSKGRMFWLSVSMNAASWFGGILVFGVTDTILRAIRIALAHT